MQTKERNDNDFNDNDFSTTRTMRTALAAARRLTASRAPSHAPVATTRACAHSGIGMGLASHSRGIHSRTGDQPARGEMDPRGRRWLALPRTPSRAGARRASAPRGVAFISFMSTHVRSSRGNPDCCLRQNLCGVRSREWARQRRTRLYPPPRTTTTVPTHWPAERDRYL